MVSLLLFNAQLNPEGQPTQVTQGDNAVVETLLSKGLVQDSERPSEAYRVGLPAVAQLGVGPLAALGFPRRVADIPRQGGLVFFIIAHLTRVGGWCVHLQIFKIFEPQKM